MDDNEQDDRGKIPNLMQLGSIPVDLTMDQDTETLDPVVNSQTFCRFVLSNKGFLHSFSKIILGVDNAGDGTFPVNIGVHSLIERATLRIGTTVVAELDDFNHWMGYKSLFIDNQTNKERETYTTSRIMAHDFVLKNDDNAQSDVNASFYGLNTNLEYDVFADGDSGNLQSQPEIRTGNKPTFAIAMADLFPFLQFNQLPLFAITQQVSVELHFTPQASLKRCIHVKTDEPSGTLFNIDETQTKFVADYIYYSPEKMSEQAELLRDTTWTYNDYRLNKRTFTQGQLQDNTIIDIGGAGRLINKVVTALEGIRDPADSHMLNRYTSCAPSLVTNNNGRFTTNLIYNDNRLYPIDRTNSALHFHDLVQAENNVANITRQEFTSAGTGGGLADDYTYMNYEPVSVAEGLNGNFHYIAYVLNRNERVNSRGIQLQLQYSTVNNITYTHRSWLEMVKTARLQDGMFSCDLL